jgi:hypothetical protein
VVLSAPGLADGYRLAGCSTVVAPPGPGQPLPYAPAASADIGVLL